LADDSQLAGIAFLDVLEHEDHQLADQVEHFEVVVLNFHFQIEAREFTKMAIGVRVFSSEDWADFEHTTQVTAECHLLVQLGALRETCGLAEILKLKDVGAALGRAANQLWGVDFYEIS